jgi:Domain of unknown function (DUF6766)
VRSFFHRNSLSIVLFSVFALAVVGQALAGWKALEHELAIDRLPPLRLLDYLGTGHFRSALFENWESEFLQLSAYVLLTIFLRQKGSPESKDLEGKAEQDADPSEGQTDPHAPGLIRQGSIVRWLYANSLGLALGLLFVVSFVLHLLGSTQLANEEAAREGQPPITVSENLSEPQFWYESFQNWQSEFFAVGVFIVLGVYLRQRGSPESKPVTAPHDATGR